MQGKHKPKIDYRIQNKIQIFEEKKVRTGWDDETEEWYFSVIDVVEVLTGTDRLVFGNTITKFQNFDKNISLDNQHKIEKK